MACISLQGVSAQQASCMKNWPTSYTTKAFAANTTYGLQTINTFSASGLRTIRNRCKTDLATRQQPDQNNSFFEKVCFQFSQSTLSDLHTEAKFPDYHCAITGGNDNSSLKSLDWHYKNLFLWKSCVALEEFSREDGEPLFRTWMERSHR